MNDPTNASRLYNFDPPRRILDDDSSFPAGTICTLSDGRDLQCMYTKRGDGLWSFATLDDPLGQSSSGQPFAETNLATGAIATIFKHTGTIEYVKVEDGRWFLAPLGEPVADQYSEPGDTGSAGHVRVLHQAMYRAQDPPKPAMTPIKYHNVRLSSILNDKMVVQEPLAPAFDISVVKNTKLSLRFLFPGAPYKSEQFRVKTGKKSISRANPADHIARELFKLTVLLGTCELRLSDSTKVEFDRLVLVSVALPSKGSIQPTIGVI
ncbi:hypothetical protein C8Q77DRAFT_708558 [Trametes polyzona]|nr:hypothetical protein C8Q77DRAFT_708558 [Trametes polyzona]